jgi:cyanate permease
VSGPESLHIPSIEVKNRFAQDRGLYRLVMLTLAFNIAFLLHLLVFSTAPMVTAIMQEMGLSHTDFGLLFSILMVSLMLFRIPWGMVGDRIGYRNAFRIALPIIAVFAVLRAFAPGYPTLLLSQFFIGLGIAAILPCLPLIIKTWATTNPGFATGVYIAGFASGNGTALALTPYLMEIMSWRQVLLIYAGYGVLIALLWWIIARAEVRGTASLRLGSFTRIFKDRYVWVLLILMMAGAGGYDTLTTWMPRVLELKGVSTSLASLLALGFFLAGPVVGIFADRLKNTRLLIAMLGVLAAGSVVGINYAPLPLLLPCILLAGFATIGVLTIILSAPTRHPRLSPVAGSVVGMITSLGNTASLLLPIFFGYLIDVTGTYQTSILVVAAISGLILVMFSRFSE